MSLAWPWPGRSLPQGNQWECWDPGLGPNVAGLPVHLSPQYTPDTPNNPKHPIHPIGAPMPSDAPIPLLALSTYSHCQPPIHLWHPLHPLMPSDAPDIPIMALNTSYTPNSPQYPLMPPIPLLAAEYLQSMSAPNIPTPLGAPFLLVPPILF